MATGLVRVPVDEPVQGRFAYLEYPGILELSGFEQMQRFRMPFRRIDRNRSPAASALASVRRSGMAGLAAGRR